MTRPKKNPTRVQWTAEDLKEAILLIKNKRCSVLKCSKDFNIPRRTLRDYLQKDTDEKKRMGPKSTLTDAEEENFCARILRLADLGFPITSLLLRKAVFEFCEENQISHHFNGAAGKDWLLNFLKRHPNISRRRAQNLNEARAQKLNPFIVNDYFDKLENILKANNFLSKPERIYNLDEKGIRLCLHKSPTVLARKGAKRVHSRGKEHGENVTVVGCVNAIGNVVPPMIIFKGKRKQDEWGDDLPTGSVIEMSDRGSMTNVIFVKWLDHFKNFKPTGKCLVILDGATSHIDLSIAKKAEKLDVVLFCLPSNTSHELQPLDKSVFHPLEVFWDNELQNFWKHHAERTLTKNRFAKIFTPAWERATTPSNVKSGFKACGIYPFDRRAIPEEAFHPSEVTSNDQPQNVATTSNDLPQNTVPLKEITNTPTSQVMNFVTNEESTSSSGTSSVRSSDSVSKILPSPHMVRTTTRRNRKAINSRAVIIQKSLFGNDNLESDLESACSELDDPDFERLAKKSKLIKKKPPKKTFKSQLMKKLKNKRKISKTPRSPQPGTSSSSASWYCYLCKKDEIKDMTPCSSCLLYVHDECIGFTKTTVEAFICPNCESD